MKSWARVPIVSVAAAILLFAGTTAALADHDPGGASGKQHPGVRPPHQGAAADTNGSTAGTASQPTTGAPTSQSSTNTHHGATVTRDLACGIATPPFGSVTATDSMFVLTRNGHATLVCKGHLPAGVGPKSAIVIEALPCSAPGVAPTTESHTTITPSGEVSLTCHFSG